MSTGRTREHRVWSYVAVLVLVPILGVLALSAGAIRPRLSAFSRSQDARARVTRMSNLVTLSSLLGDIQLPLATKSVSGLRGPLLVAVMGFDPVKLEAKATAAIREFVRQHPRDPTIREAGRQFEETLQEIDATEKTQPLSGQDVVAKFRRIQSDLDRTWRQEVKLAVGTEVIGSRKLQIRLEVVQAILSVGMAVQQQHETIFSLVQPKGKDVLSLRAALAAFRASETSLLATIAAKDADYPQRLAEIKKYLGEPTTRTFINQIKEIIGGADYSLEKLGAAKVAKGVRDGIGRSDSINTLTRNALEDAKDAATKLERETKRALGQTIAIVLIILGFSVLVAAKISEAVTNPLRALAARARRVAAGDLDLSHGSVRGPAEVNVVGSVLDELVSNLQRVQGQAVAVATGTLDAAILTEQVPGPLGQSLAASVTRLVRSVRERDELQELLAEQATHDSLTGLPNRAAALLAVEQAIARANRRHDRLAVMFLDLDDFKRANDECGHAVGDEVLRITAGRIVGAVRTGDVVARLGGDEFLVVAEAMESNESIRELGERVVESVSAPMEIEGRRIRIGASVGFAVPDHETKSASELLRRADLAMYQAKGNGRGRVVEFDHDLSRSTELRINTEQAVRVALHENQFRLHYQPVLNAVTGRMESVEALLRWDRPGHGEQSPGSFIPLVEESPLIVDVGRWVLKKAAIEISTLRKQPEFSHVCVAVNLSGRHLLNVGLLDDVRTALEESSLLPSALTIEITETMLVTDHVTVLEQTRGLRALGVKVAIDDFGTGYTSIGQLSRLPVDVLKIDQAFVDQIATTSSRRIVELIIEVGHTLGMKIVAEGVEDAEQLRILQSLHCDYVQGYCFSQPLRLTLQSLPALT